MFDDNEIKGKGSSSNNYWFYSTIVLVGLFVVGGIAYVAYYLGQKSTPDEVERVDISSNTANTQAISPARANISTGNSSQITNSITMPSVAPGSESMAINGEMFIVTKGRQNIRLALVDVCVLSEPSILSWIRQKQLRAKSEQEAAKARVDALRGELRAIQNDLDASDSNGRGYNEARFSLERAKINKTSDVLVAEVKLRYWTSPEYYLEGIRDCQASTKSDSDGRFKLDLPGGKRYALAAQTNRRILDSSETYWWLIWLDPNNPNQTISLNNDNLMSANPANRVIPVAPYVSSVY